ncbi:hypothetical protein HanRHA438_Chr10g0475141 [Helianthus annuus]|uniref:Uncharacterized protein n=2 Tax=Helianthus annuus TaxID=4232 RepID=A0A9K3N665_HELAN|nr:hypothetical protein HanXRQr2_Chr10g0462691 [Helianthus annuus]KAJ0523878.1 hypothetical protein HanIR_Chr10g0498541 [Helianthus annuus]KAJ0881518.1 hypothetical protein HanRHA438_Chr10g0475141 [Helianthus annuus]KAJ0885553.1 hypothetical protein HanPSC8_Chr10g0446511 [Helianthus annuus]
MAERKPIFNTSDPSSSSQKRSRSTASYQTPLRPTLPEPDETKMKDLMHQLLVKDMLTMSEVTFAQRQIADCTWVADSFLKMSHEEVCRIITKARDEEDAWKRKRRME